MFHSSREILFIDKYTITQILNMKMNILNNLHFVFITISKVIRDTYNDYIELSEKKKRNKEEFLNEQSENKEDTFVEYLDDEFEEENPS